MQMKPQELEHGLSAWAAEDQIFRRQLEQSGVVVCLPGEVSHLSEALVGMVVVS